MNERINAYTVVKMEKVVEGIKDGKNINDIGAFTNVRKPFNTHLYLCKNIHTLYILWSRPNDASDHAFLSPLVLDSSLPYALLVCFAVPQVFLLQHLTKFKIDSTVHGCVCVWVNEWMAECVCVNECVAILSCGTYHFHLNGWNMINSKNFHSRFFVQTVSPHTYTPTAPSSKHYSCFLSLSLCLSLWLIFHNWSWDGECMNHYFYLNKITFC